MGEEHAVCSWDYKHYEIVLRRNSKYFYLLRTSILSFILASRKIVCASAFGIRIEESVKTEDSICWRLPASTSISFLLQSESVPG